MIERVRLILASESPRRLELLRQIGLDPEPVPSGLHETARDGEPPEDVVSRLAAAKAAAVLERLGPASRPTLVLAADTAVVLGETVLGKPADEADARRMLRMLSGRVHRVLTAVRLVQADDGRSSGEVAETRVRFRELSEATVRWYAASGEPADKAGAYGIQGRGAVLVSEIRGSYSNVVGLPLERLPQLLAQVGIPFPGDDPPAGRQPTNPS